MMGDALTDDHHNENRSILKDLTDSAPEGVAKILKCYDHDCNGDEILKELKKFYKTELQLAADHLKQLPSMYKYKDDLVKAIIARMDNILLEKCPKCRTFYSVGIDDTPTVSCSSCDQGAHDSCYKDLGPILVDYPGVKYLCSRCVDSKPTRKATTVDATPSLDSIVHGRDTSLPHSSSFNHTEIQHDDEERDEDSLPICEKYRRGSCPHGISGRTLFNGKKCDYSHPKRCQKFCKYGPDSREGCEKGRDCDLLHPILCRYALRSKMCLNLQCKFTHIKGTKRIKPCDQQNDRQRYPGNNNENRSNSRSDSDTPQVDLNIRPGFNSPTLNQQTTTSFLSQLVEQLREMQKEIKEVKAMHKTYPYPQYPWFPAYNNQMTTPPQYQNQHHVTAIHPTAVMPQLTVPHQ